MSEQIHTVHLPLVGTTNISFYDISADIYQYFFSHNEFDRQKNIKHLGKISDVIPSFNHSRYEYLMLQCFFTDLYENVYKGTPNAAGSLTYNGRLVPGNALIKSWFLLSNFGHAKNTIADEKALLLFSFERKGFKNNLLSSIKDPDLKTYAEQVISNYNYRSFHHLISLWRIEKEISRRRVFKNDLISIYKLLLLDNPSGITNPEKLRSLKSVYKILRYISIISLDSHNAHLPFSLNLLSTLTSIDFYEKRFQPKSIINILHPLLSVLYEEIYLDKQVLTKTREYEINAINKCKSSTSTYSSYDSLIKGAIHEGLTDDQSIKLAHLTRYSFNDDVKFEKDLLDEYRKINTIKKGGLGIEASLDFNPITKKKYIDYYTNASFTINQLPPILNGIADIFENQLNKHISQKDSQLIKMISTLKRNLKTHGLTDQVIHSILSNPEKELFKVLWGSLLTTCTNSFKEIISSIILLFINPKFTLEIKQNLSDDRIIGIKLKSIPLNNINSNIDKLIANTL